MTTRATQDGWWRDRLWTWGHLLLIVAGLVVAGCDSGSISRGASNITGSTELHEEVPAGGRAKKKAAAPPGPAGLVAAVRNRFLFEHNAQFFHDRTFRWVPPIPIHAVTGEPGLDNFLLEQFLAWEVALGPSAGSPFYAPQAVSRQVPRRGIFFAFGDLPGEVIGAADPFVEVGESRSRSTVARQLPRLTMPEAPRRMEVPEVLANGQIQRCVIVLDPVLADASDNTLRAVIRHEIGHCLGMIGHVSSGLMKPTCCALNITSDVIAMMRLLYSLPPGTPVTP